MSNDRSLLLDIRGLTVAFETDGGEVRAVQDVSFGIGRGEVVGLVGESGCGKSVTAMSIPRLIPSPPGRVLCGEIHFDGRDLLSLPVAEMRHIRGRDIGVIFQEPMTALSPLHRVGRQLVEAVRIHEECSKAEAWERGIVWLERVGIPDPAERMHSYPFQLSGGMRQRVMTAMALILEPKFVIADEPTTALDVTIQAQILELMLEMCRGDTSLLLITHDMGVIWESCERVLVMYASRIVEEGGVKDLFERPLHPYTQGLLESMPVLAGETDRLPCIKGQVPAPDELPPGCNFAERCPHAQSICREKEPPLAEFGERRSACFFSDRWV